MARVAVQSLMTPLGSPAPAFSLPDVSDEKLVQLDDFATAPALLVMFLCNHCPYVRHIERELGRLLNEFPQLAAVGISVNDVTGHPDDAPEQLAAQRERAGWQFPYLFDASQQSARDYRAACTPDFFLYDGERRLYYRGAFDESTPGNGKPVTGGYLRAAIDAVLVGAPTPTEQLPSLGCSIKFREPV